VATYYCDRTDIARIVERLDEIVPATEDISPFLEMASREVDIYLGRRYRVPLDEPIPGLVRSLTAQLVAYHILRRRYTAEDPARNAWVESFRETAMEALQAIARGELSIPGLRPRASASLQKEMKFGWRDSTSQSK